MPLLPDASRPTIGATGHGHPDTSRRAAVLGQVRFGTQKARLLSLIAGAGGDGMTAAEAAKRLGLSRNQTATRLGELREDGWVVRLETADGKYVERATDTLGNTGIVHVLSDDGRVAFTARFSGLEGTDLPVEASNMPTPDEVLAGKVGSVLDAHVHHRVNILSIEGHGVLYCVDCHLTLIGATP